LLSKRNKEDATLKTRTLLVFLGGIISAVILGCCFDLKVLVEIIARLFVAVQIIFFFSGVGMATAESLRGGKV